MNRRITGVFGAAAAFALVATVVPGSAQASPPATADGQQTTAKSKLDDRPDARESKRRELRKEAVEQVATGKAKPQDRGGSQAVKVGKKQWVEYGTQQNAQILSFLVNFGDTKDSRFPTAPAGPTSGQIPQPDRS